MENAPADLHLHEVEKLVLLGEMVCEIVGLVAAKCLRRRILRNSDSRHYSM
jgi:hypothetical protein